MSGERDGEPGIADPAIRTLTSCINLGESQSGRLGGNAKEEGLDIILDNPAIERMQMGLDE